MGLSLKFFAKSAGRCFAAPLIEITHNSVSLRWSFYAYIQLIRGRFLIQLWTVKSSASHASRENTLLSCGKIQKCSRNLLRRFADGRTDGAYFGGRRCVRRVHSVVYNASAASAETRGAGHMLSEKSQRTQNGTMFVGLDWPLNASCRLSASAKLLVSSGAAVMFFFPIFLDHISTQISNRSSFDLLPQHALMNLVASFTAASTDESKFT